MEFFVKVEQTSPPTYFCMTRMEYRRSYARCLWRFLPVVWWTDELASCPCAAKTTLLNSILSF
jgi:hypothetical protein